MKAKRVKAPLPSTDGPKSVALASVLDLKAAAPLAEELVALRGSDLVIDGSGVQRVGAQCLQVLVAARRTWAADRAEFAIVAASEHFQATAALLGASAALFDLVEIRL